MKDFPALPAREDINYSTDATPANVNGLLVRLTI
jgi:hypothetical protein